MTDTSKIRIATLLGTSRPGNYTGKALALVCDELAKNDHVEVVSFDPAGKRLAFPGESGDFPDAKALQEIVETATGIIFATPEYHGSPAAMAKLIVENMGFPSRLAGKPVALLGAASGRIGAIKSLEMMRSICSTSAPSSSRAQCRSPVFSRSSTKRDGVPTRPSRNRSAGWPRS